MPSKVYSYIYGRLVEDEKDILGHIAYSIYKNQKIEEIKRLKIGLGLGDDQDVSDEELKAFIGIAQTDRQIRFYKDKAESLALEFVQEILKEEMENLNIKLEEEREDLRKNFYKNYKSTGFFYGVAQSIVASVLFVLFGVVFLFTTGGWARIGKALVEMAK